MNPRRLAALCLGIVSALTASAQFTGGDNFASDGTLNTSLWTLNSNVFGSATFTESATGLRFTSGGSANDAAILGWNAPASNAQDWSAGINVYRPTTLPLSSDPSHVEIGLFINATNPVLTGGIPNDVFSIAFDAYYSGSSMTLGVFTSGRTGGGTMGDLGYTTLPGLDNVRLGISYNAATSTLSAGYSTDGGATFLPVTGISSVSTSGWAFPSGSSFQVSILGASDHYAVTSGNDVMALGFQASAIPEPSTYAVLLGCVALLGTILYRRRT